MVTEDWARGWPRRVGLAAALAGLLAAYAAANAPEPASSPSPPALLPAAQGSPIRQSEADAVAHAVAIGERVEVAAFRGESREVYANPDGTMTAVERAQPVRVVREGRWTPVDATLLQAEDGSIGPRAATIDLRLSGGGDGPLARVERAGRVLSLDWPGTLPEPTVTGDQATYSEVLPGVDMVVNVGVTGFSHVLVIKDAEAAQNPALVELELGLSTDGLVVRDDPEGGLAAVDVATGGTVFEAATPMMWDSGVDGEPGGLDARANMVGPVPPGPEKAAPASARRAPVGVRIGPDTLTLLPDRAMLTDPKTRWPVYIDPIWQDTRNSGWAMVASGKPAERYWKFSGDEGVGDCPVIYGGCNGVAVKRIYYALPTPYAGRTIISADFNVTMTHTVTSSARNVSLYLAGSGISSGTNWSNKPSLIDPPATKAPTATQGSCTSTNQNVEFDVTAAITKAASQGWSTTTFGLRAQNESDQTAWKRFCGNALLSVNYNRPPSQPKQSELTMSPGGQCISGASRPYVDTPPTLFMVLRDPDHSSAATEDVRGEIYVYWTNGAGTRVTRTYHTGWKASGSRFQFALPADIPKDIPITWEVRAWDSEVAGPWSWEGDAQTACQFIHDSDAPVAPDIDSPEYLPEDVNEDTSACVEDNQWRGSVGIYGTFTFDTADTDAVKYLYGFDANPSPNNVLTPPFDGAPVSVRWMPENDGPNFVTAQAVDRAGLAGGIATCTFAVPTRPAVGEWGLGEPAEAEAAADARGIHPAAPGAGVVFGVPGPGCQDTGAQCQLDRSVRLSGAADSYLATGSAGLVDTSTGFGVAVWVRLTDDTRDRIAVSQDGSGEPGFTLGFDATTRKWEFKIPATDVKSLGGWSVTSTDVAVLNEWTHLAVAYDPVLRTIALYVNGDPQPVAQRRSAWKSRGALQIGRGYARGGHTGQWVGMLADVAVFDRIVVSREATELAKLRPIRLGYWPLDEATDDRSPEYDADNGQELLLAGGAGIYRPDPEIDPFAEPALIGPGHLVLDGADDYAGTGAAVASTDGSFTVTLRVRLASPTCGRDMAVVSQVGTVASAFAIRCSAGERWEVALPQSDTVNAPSTVAFDDRVLPNADQRGQHLALVYNSFLNEVRLYVDGENVDSAVVSHTSAWQATGGLQVGRVLIGGVYGEYFAGVVDEVRAYTGVADASTIQELASLDPNPYI